MRFKTMITFIYLWLVPFTCLGKQDMDLLYSAHNQREILEWGKKLGYCQSITFEENKKKLLVLLIDRGSGVECDSIFVYLWEKEQWRFRFFRITYTKVAVENTEKSLIFKSKLGKILLEQPFDGID